MFVVCIHGQGVLKLMHKVEGRVRVGGGGDSAIWPEGNHKPGDAERVHSSSQVPVPCDFKSFKRQANLAC